MGRSDLNVCCAPVSAPPSYRIPVREAQTKQANKGAECRDHDVLATLSGNVATHVPAFEAVPGIRASRKRARRGNFSRSARDFSRATRTYSRSRPRAGLRAGLSLRWHQPCSGTCHAPPCSCASRGRHDDVAPSRAARRVGRERAPCDAGRRRGTSPVLRAPVRGLALSAISHSRRATRRGDRPAQ